MGIMSAFRTAGDTHIYRDSDGYEEILGRNDHVSDLHREAREAHLVWRDHGKPRYGHLYRNICVTRLNVERALRWCRKHKDKNNSK